MSGSTQRKEHCYRSLSSLSPFPSASASSYFPSTSPSPSLSLSLSLISIPYICIYLYLKMPLLMYDEQYTFKIYNLICFDIYIYEYMHPWNHHHNQDNGYPSHPEIFLCPFKSPHSCPHLGKCSVSPWKRWVFVSCWEDYFIIVN